ncbi:hypothetical protein EV421DRAFT_1911335 [Armillaria borealis]|uniref:Zn(2)-C6 fungal-type domain-containing protein n=1 Tax=Armillaria borealis TaxID=47425 RepID=A0AA39MEL5_9AGAR|nr:hypothetical protein EV421DRAFT_1911335 [Armillaria borealis]
MSAKVHVEIPTRTTSIGPRLCRTNTPIDGKEKMAESVDVIDGMRLPMQSHASSHRRSADQECEPDIVETRPSSRNSPLSDLDTSTDDDQIQTSKEKTSNTTGVVMTRASAKAEWPTIAMRLGHKTRDHGGSWKDYQTRVLQNLGSHLLKGPERHQEIARLAMDAGEYAHMVVICDPTDYGARLKKQGEPKTWRLENAEISTWGVEPVHRPIPCQRCIDAGIPCMFTNSRQPNNAVCRLCSVKFSRCDDTTSKNKRPAAKQPESVDHKEGSTSSGKRKSGDETSGSIQAASKKHKFDLFTDDSSPLSSTPYVLPTSTDFESTKSVPALISELWTKETKKYEARIQELDKERDRSTSTLVVYQRELHAAKQQSTDFKARVELLEAEIATLKGGKVMLEERVGSTKKALEDLKSKFLVKVIQATDEIMTGFDEIGAQ